MLETPQEEAEKPLTLSGLIETTRYKPGRQKPPCCPPALPPELQLKWGLALLGEAKAFEYLQWLQERLKDQPQ